MRRCIAACLAIIALACVTRSAIAQSANIVPGVRVRVATMLHSNWIDGTILERTADSLVLVTQPGAQARLAWMSIKSLDVYRGHSVVAGAKRGFLWGAVTAIPLMLTISSRDSTVHPNAIASVAAGAAVMSLFGIFGAVIGAPVGRDTWESAALQPVLQPVVQHAGGRTGIGVRLLTF